jgi:hypothetical protein
LAVIEEIIPIRDGEVRLVKLWTASGILLRPIQRLYHLEIYDEEPLRCDQPSVGVAQDAEATSETINRKDNGLKETSSKQVWEKDKASFTISYLIRDF